MIEILLMTDESPKLTNREIEVLAEICKGSTFKEIGAELLISSGTVESHRRNLLLKFGVRNTVELAVTAVRKGIV